MGLFDSLYVGCPHCRKIVEIQSKAGSCSLSQYNINNAPIEILTDLEDAPQICSHCSKYLSVKLHLSYRATVEKL